MKDSIISRSPYSPTILPTLIHWVYSWPPPSWLKVFWTSLMLQAKEHRLIQRCSAHDTPERVTVAWHFAKSLALVLPWARRVSAFLHSLLSPWGPLPGLGGEADKGKKRRCISSQWTYFSEVAFPPPSLSFWRMSNQDLRCRADTAELRTRQAAHQPGSPTTWQSSGMPATLPCKCQADSVL